MDRSERFQTRLVECKPMVTTGNRSEMNIVLATGLERKIENCSHTIRIRTWDNSSEQPAHYQWVVDACTKRRQSTFEMKTTKDFLPDSGREDTIPDLLDAVTRAVERMYKEVVASAEEDRLHHDLDLQLQSRIEDRIHAIDIRRYLHGGDDEEDNLPG